MNNLISDSVIMIELQIAKLNNMKRTNFASKLRGSVFCPDQNLYQLC